MGTKIPVPRTEAPEDDPVIEHINTWPGEKVSINTSDRNTSPVFNLVTDELPEELIDITNKFCAAWASHLSGEDKATIEEAIVTDIAATKAAIVAQREAIESPAKPVEELRP